MRHFHSYGPVDCADHFCVARQALVESCIAQLVGNPEEGGHYFTIWAPRQTGKTWLMRQMREEIPKRYSSDRFTIFDFSLGNLRGMEEMISAEKNRFEMPLALISILRNTLPGKPDVKTWDDFVTLFAREGGLWDRPLILMIDEVDTAPPVLLDWIVGRFREMYLYRQTNWLHGLALIGVRAVLGIESQRGSPFNVQRSLHVPNFTLAEVQDLYIQDTLYHAFSSDLVGTDMPLLALHPLDDLADVFANPAQLDLPALLRRYKEYLARLKAKGINPWKEQPRRQTDLPLTEAVGHFHLYAWLQNTIGRRCAVTPEFPTGNGRVDLHIGCAGQRGIIEVKSFVDQYQAGEDRKQAVRYAQRLGFERVTLAVFVPIEEESVLEKLSVSETIHGITVDVVAIGWT